MKIKQTKKTDWIIPC